MRNRLLIFIVLLSLNFIVSANTPWSLSDCIYHAHAHNIQIKRTELQAEISEINKIQAYTNLAPDLNANINRNYSFGRRVDPFTNEYIETDFAYDNYSITSRLTLFSGLQNFNNIKSNTYATLAAIQQVERVKIDQAIAISAAYLDLLFQQEQVVVAKKQQEVTRMQVERTQKLVAAGSVAKGVLLEIDAQLANEILNVTTRQNELQLARLNLVQLLDLDSAEGFEIVTPDSIDPDNMTPLLSVTQIYNSALGYLPHIKQSEYELQSIEKYLAMQKGRRSPTLYASGSIYTGYSSQRMQSGDNIVENGIGYLSSDPNQLVVQPGFEQVDYPYSNQLEDNITQSVSIGVSIPIVNRWEVNNSISKARLNVEDAQYQLSQTKQQLLKSIQQAYNDALSAHDKYQSATRATESYQESFRYTEQKFNVGMVNSVEYNVAKNNLIKAESDQLQAKYAYVFAVKLLGLYQGMPISL